MTYMWQEERGQKYFRFQTDEPAVNKKMRERKKFILVGWGWNCNLWIYQVKLYKPQNARRTLKALTGKPIKFDKLSDTFLV